MLSSLPGQNAHHRLYLHGEARTLRPCVVYWMHIAMPVKDMRQTQALDEYPSLLSQSKGSIDPRQQLCENWQILENVCQEEKTTLTTKCFRYCYLLMFFGLEIAPSSFQCALDIIKLTVKWQLVLVNLHVAIIFEALLRSFCTYMASTGTSV